MELISREEVKKLLNEGWYSGVYPSSAIMSLPTVKAIPLDRVEQIISEMQSLRGCSCSCSDGIIDDVEDIIDKAIKEQNE